MRFARPLVRGSLVRRYNRFLADVTLADGASVTAHCPNPGSMMGLNAPGLAVWLEPTPGPGRKLSHAWRLVELPEGRWAGIDATLPNRIVAEALAARALPAFAAYPELRPERRYGANSRVDFLLTGPGLPPLYLEVKNVHLRREADWAEFPDCVTARGAKHLREMAAMVAAGARAATLYVVQRDDCARMRLAADIDPGYAAAFAAARAAGVETHVHATTLSTEGVALAGALPFVGPPR